MAVKHLVFNPETNKVDWKSFRSEKEYREFRKTPEQKKFDLAVDLKVYGESANKKLATLERKGLESSPAYKQAIHQIHLITGDTEATRFPTGKKSAEIYNKMKTPEIQKALQAAYKFGHVYETATPGGYEKVQRKARKGFNKRFSNASKLTKNQYDMINNAAEVLCEMYGALVPPSQEMYDMLIEIGNNKQYTDNDIMNFAVDLQNEIEKYPSEAQNFLNDYKRHFLSQGLRLFALGEEPSVENMVKLAYLTEREKWKRQGETYGFNSDSDFPYK